MKNLLIKINKVLILPKESIKETFKKNIQYVIIIIIMNNEYYLKVCYNFVNNMSKEQT